MSQLLANRLAGMTNEQLAAFVKAESERYFDASLKGLLSRAPSASDMKLMIEALANRLTPAKPLKLDLESNLAPNFKLREVVDWPRHQPMSAADKALATRLATEALTPQVVTNARAVAQDLQELRTWVNAQFPKYKGKIGILVTSWLRPRAWELHRKRSGDSQHTAGWGVDFIVIGVSEAEYNIIMEAIFKRYANWPGGLARSVDKAGRYRFIHLDKRPGRARWTY
jgi:hypothetical protein